MTENRIMILESRVTFLENAVFGCDTAPVAAFLRNIHTTDWPRLYVGTSRLSVELFRNQAGIWAAHNLHQRLDWEHGRHCLAQFGLRLEGDYVVGFDFELTVS